MHKLHDVTEKDSKSINEFVYRLLNPEFIKGLEIKLVWNYKTPRNGDTWQALAIRFNENFTQNELIKAIVSLKPEEYWGMQDGYHIFWYD